MLQRVHEHVIVEHALVVSFFFLAHLLQEQLLLHEWVVEFGVGVAELVVFDEEFEAFGESGFGAVVLGKGRHELWMFDDEGGVEALGFEEAADQFVDEADGGSGVGAVDVMFLALMVEEDLCLFRGEVLRDGLSQLLLELLHHRDAAPGRSEVDV